MWVTRYLNWVMETIITMGSTWLSTVKHMQLTAFVGDILMGIQLFTSTISTIFPALIRPSHVQLHGPENRNFNTANDQCMESPHPRAKSPRLTPQCEHRPDQSRLILVWSFCYDREPSWCHKWSIALRLLHGLVHVKSWGCDRFIRN